MKKHFIILLVLVGFTSAIVSCKMENTDPYSVKIKNYRFSKDSFLKSSKESPMDPKGKRELIALAYFEPDKKYDIKGHLELLDTPKPVRMQVTNSRPESYLNLGVVVFEMNGHQNKLTVYQIAKTDKDPATANELFCPFTDQTNGKETYKGGRFLDLHLTPNSKEIEIDFNYAYNPYCAYNHDYNCPIPPPQNHLNFKVEAGEKAYKTGRFSLFK
jgi:uncharacterized protein (DUF1684 family)